MERRAAAAAMSLRRPCGALKVGARRQVQLLGGGGSLSGVCALETFVYQVGHGDRHRRDKTPRPSPRRPAHSRPHRHCIHDLLLKTLLVWRNRASSLLCFDPGW